MTERITFEDVLDELMLEEPKPDYEALVRWQNRYPQYRDQLADFFATWGVQEYLAESGVPEPDIDEEKLIKMGVEHAMEILRRQGRIIEKTEVVTLEPFDLIFGRDADPETEPGGKIRRYFTVTLVGERALATAKSTSTVVAKALEGFA